MPANGTYLICLTAATLVLLLFLILVVKLHAFIALLISAMAMGLASGMPPDKAAAHVGADVAQERAPCHGLDQVAQVGAFAFVGDDGAADLQEPSGTGLAHGRDDAVHAVLDDGGGAGAARAYRRDDGIRGCDGRGD